MAAYMLLVSEIVVFVFTLGCMKYGASLTATLIVVTVANAAIIVSVFSKMRGDEKRTRQMEESLTLQWNFNFSLLSPDVLARAAEERLIFSAKLLVMLRTKLIRLSAGGLQAIYTTKEMAQFKNPIQQFEEEKRLLKSQIQSQESYLDSLFQTTIGMSRLYKFKVKSREDILKAARKELELEEAELERRQKEELREAGFA